MTALISDEERASWNVTDKGTEATELVLCECVATSKSEKMITPQGKSKPVLACSFVLKLVEIATGEEITCYLKYNKSPKGNAAVKHDGKFAMLYRLTIGDDPRKRYSEAQYLVNHFLGHQFLVSHVIAKTSENYAYKKTASIKPANPIVTDGWTITGKLRRTFKPRKNTQKLGKVLDEPWKVLGKVLEKPWTEKPEEAHSYLASPTIYNASKSILAREVKGIKACDSSTVIDADNHSTVMTTANSNVPKVYREVF